MQQIKSKSRVKEHAEVFTNQREVVAMCDLIPSEIWDNIESTFLEPSVGEAVFLIEILKRKFKLCKSEKDGLRALNSLFGIDIQQDNVEISRRKLLDTYKAHFPNANDFALQFAQAILEQNIICCDSLSAQIQLQRGIEWQNIDKSLVVDLNEYNRLSKKYGLDSEKFLFAETLLKEKENGN